MSRKTPEEVLLLVGQKVAAARHKRGEQQDTVAAAAGVSQAVMSQIENGSYEGLKLTTLQKICAYLQIPITEIFD